MSDAGMDDPKETEIRNLLPGYVLGILEPEELLAIDEYLAEHPRFWDEVQALEKTTNQLAYGAPPASPPLGTKEEILSRIQPNVSRTPAAVSTGMAASSGNQRAAKLGRLNPNTVNPTRRNPNSGNPAPLNPNSGNSALRMRPNQPQRQMASRSRPVNTPLPRRGWVRSFGAWWSNALGWKMYSLATTAAIALLAIIFSQTQNELAQTLSTQVETNEQIVQLETEQEALAAQLNTLASENNDRSTEAETLRIASIQLESQVDQLQTEVADLESEKGDLLQAVELLEAELSENEQFFAALPLIEQVVTLGGNGPAPDASGTLFAGPSGGYLVLTGLEPLPDTQTYQLWLIPDDSPTPISSGLIAVTEEGTAQLSVELALDVEGFTSVGLSIEPAGGSESPTEEDIVLLGTKGQT